MATCYAPPEHLTPPAFDPQNHAQYNEQCDAFEKSVSDWCRAESNCPDAGKIISFPIADGKARYAIYNYRTLIHLATGDAYDIPDAHMRGLKKDDIVKAVKRIGGLRALFANKAA